MSNFNLRVARREDCDDIMRLVHELALFENMEDRIRVTTETLKEDGFGETPFYKCFVAEKSDNEGKLLVVGYALYFFIYSTFEGKSSFLEDLYVKKEHRGQGIGTALWREVAQEAVKRGCSRMDFTVLNWNEKAAKTYIKRGAVDLTKRDKWHLWRLEADSLKDFASST